MLKSLELNGFKSFADFTRFEFPQGITAVVGPNGSGKSNVVDGIKWVLGSQSAKAMRGKEMTDVIFSGAGSRGQTNSAEVTLSFDNANGDLEYDGDEVHITRRAYRSGESEYLINRQTCRLRDIRDLFSGTGMSTGAYSIIEQGKVDALLQSTPRERRLIFEEAAGVSRFKLKRQEAARRLERVDQNLLRLSDIVDELDSRLRSVRSQAGRAQTYKQQSDRLKLLRTQVALADWRQFSASLQQVQQHVAEVTRERDVLKEQVTDNNRRLAESEEATSEYQRKIAHSAAETATVRERIAQCESTRRSQSARSDELLQETGRLQKQLLAMNSRVGSAQQLVEETSDELAAAEEQFKRLQGEAVKQQAELDFVAQTLISCKAQWESRRNDHGMASHDAAQLENRLHLLGSQRATALATVERHREQVEHAKAVQQQLAEQLAAAELTLNQVEAEEQTSLQLLTETRTTLRKNREQYALSQKQLADLGGRLSGARERANVLEELERRLDGLSAGTKEVLRLAQEQPDGPFGGVRGVVADLLHVDADTAPLVEIALGEKANHLVIDRADPRLLQIEGSEWAGRTSFLRLDVQLPASAVDRIELSGEPGVMGRADQFVQMPHDLAPLARRLLGRHWFVENLQTAVKLASGTGRGLHFVTVVGEVVGADGSLVVGPRQSATGLLSRRTELRALVDEIEQMQGRIEIQQSASIKLESAVESQDKQQQQLAERHEAQARRVGEAKLKTSSISERLQQATRDQDASSNELELANQQASHDEAEITTCRKQLASQQSELETLQVQLTQLSQQTEQLEAQLATLQSANTDNRVALARGEQRRDGLRRQMNQLHHDHQEHDQALSETSQRLAECGSQRQHLEQSVLDLSSELAELFRKKETLIAGGEQSTQQHEVLRTQRSTLLRQVDGLRESLLTRQSNVQQAELSAQQIEHSCGDLATRMDDDYGLELAAEAAMQSEAVDLGTREEIDDEIRTLRSALQNLGPVNIEALSELEAVEERHSTLAGQYDDLREAKERLEQLVAKINLESRDLFVSSLDVIRGHFQQLYSSLFGGGEADILVDDSETDDVLECGIEIIARPPGKQPRSISLLSGGERTMTCVALLLAIFRSRPSPFCVLDEVDAALDEANIDRFVEVLREFMKSTQFLVVTHSKRTMACADTLYGITMQESGVSKRVSVRFEDVSADDKTLSEPQQRAA